MQDAFSRTEQLLGAKGMERLRAARVAVFGVGGVGGYAVEALARSGIGTLALVDDDRICLTNLNRQIHALRSTVGRYKVEAARERILDINPKAEVRTFRTFYLPDAPEPFDFGGYDYILDCVDTVTAKIEILLQAQRAGVPALSCMGAGNRLDPTALRVADIYQTSVCPLARVMRRELRRRGVKRQKVVYSTEKPAVPGEAGCREHCVCPPGTQRTCAIRRSIPGSTSFVPAAAGLILAAETVKDLLRSVEEDG